MNLKKKLRDFFSMSRKADGGFTLVELIVVIAILAILGGVAVPAYSGYVTKANMGVDQQLIGEVVHALQLHYYTVGEPVSDYVILSAGPGEAGAEFADAAMVAAFGEDWENAVVLKYDGWQSSGSGVGEGYLGSSFDGKEQELLETADKLAVDFRGFLDSTDNYGDAFGPYLEEKGIAKDSIGAANAAVLYVADAAQRADQEKVASILSGISQSYADQMMKDYTKTDPTDIITTAAMNLRTELGGSSLATAAVLYAYVNSYCEASGQEMNVDLTEVNSGPVAINTVIDEFVRVTKAGALDPDKQEFSMGYLGNDPSWEGATAAKDAQALLSVLGAVDTASDALLKNINTENYYSSQPVVNMVNTYLNAAGAMQAGDVLVFLAEDGSVVVDGTAAD